MTMKAMMNVETYTKYFLILFLSLGIVSCDDDDDVIDDDEDYTGSITAMDQTISQTDNTIMVQSVTVGQNSWLVAVNSGDENTDNFIVDPVMIEEGTESDIMLTFNEDANLMEGDNEIVLKLYAESDDGILGEWDIDDEPITDTSGLLASETITVTMEAMETSAFNDYDTNGDGYLDADEVAGTYQNDFSNWDTDADGSLSDEEFSNTTFGNTDANGDDMIDEDEWNAGNTSMYGNYSGDNTFADYDTDANGTIDSDEWSTGYADSNWYGTYDADTSGSVTEDEWNTGLYNDWDTDADGMINEDEYNNYSGYTGSWSTTTGTTM
ncbi:EF-hand domain-containing protein [Zunongwangia sp. F363]|uniref:EF-hand domain-containing protein n=1 Tax=Autumnicola tepida TaxID=3075595 RepID=A0ABU3CBC5_9FLAO|nr:EF-hand domain-containing protein [Zunongwangia sp. F363]MDT0643640.1 EF-hand domain-containing protein [Zunongwangia sp. F363]